MQHTATHCCSLHKLQHIATRCNTLPHTAPHDHAEFQRGISEKPLEFAAARHMTHCNTLQHTATHCNTLQHTATHCNTLQHIATHGNTLQYTATHCTTPPGAISAGHLRKAARVAAARHNFQNGALGDHARHHLRLPSIRRRAEIGF